MTDGKTVALQSSEVVRRSQPRVGLALGGGGARGLAHLLALEVLEELGLPPTKIAGTSIGAIFGAGAAAGLTPRYMRAHIEELLSERYALIRQLFAARPRPVDRLFNLFPMRSAFLDAEVLLELLLPSRLPATIEELRVPMSIVATDFYAQEAIVLTEGPLKQAIAASIALPIIFSPVQIGGKALLDGGLVDPLPFELVKDGVDLTVAVDVSGAPRRPGDDASPRALEALFSASQILQKSIIREKLRSHRPDILVDAASEGIGVLDFHRYREILAAAEPAKDALKRQLERVLSAETVDVQGGIARVD
ncbi:MAG: patatin-like phospholipase family protein [Hyphomicrobiaceae bacterium]